MLNPVQKNRNGIVRIMTTKRNATVVLFFKKKMEAILDERTVQEKSEINGLGPKAVKYPKEALEIESDTETSTKTEQIDRSKQDQTAVGIGTTMFDNVAKFDYEAFKRAMEKGFLGC